MINLCKKTFGEFKQIQIEDFDIKSICQLSFINYPQIVAYRTVSSKLFKKKWISKKVLTISKKSDSEITYKRNTRQYGQKMF